MRLVKFPHSCVRLETSEGSIVIDPGVFSGPEPLKDADVLLITHLHFDHVDGEGIRALYARRPDLKIYGPPSLTEPLGDVPFTAVSAGDVIHTMGIAATVHGSAHAVIHPSIPVIDNVGYLVNGVYHPGDAFTLPNAPVRTLLAPVAAPWMKLSEAADFINAIAPTHVHPIHDAILSPEGQAVADRLLSGLTKCEYVRIDTGELISI